MNDIEKIIECKECRQQYFVETAIPDTCQDCIDRLYVSCQNPDCQDLILKDNAETGPNENTYCFSCFCALFATCECCKSVVFVDDTEAVEDVMYCSACAERETFVCNHCGERFRNRQAIGNFCSSCYGEHYFTCTECNEVCSNENYAQDGYCGDCAESGDDGALHNHSFKPNLHFRFNDGEKTERFYGIELEIERCGNHIPEIEYDYFFVKEDSSLDQGFEVVSHPATFAWLKDEGQDLWADILHLRKTGYRSYNTTTCGMHVHISKKAFSTWMLYKWLRFFCDNGDFILKLSGRRPDTLRKWAALDDNKEGLVYKAKDKWDEHRYSAINLTNKDTVEIRIFRGTLNPTKFWANIEFLEALFAWLEPISAKQASTLTWIDLKAYVLENATKYPNLTDWFYSHNAETTND